MDLAARLRERREEIERATLARVYGIDDPTSVGNPQYVAGLRSAVSAGLTYGIEVIDAPAGRPGPPPTELLTQARQAARNGISLDKVLRRYVAGYTLLGDFIVREAREGEIPSSALQRTLGVESALFDRVVDVVTKEYTDELQERSGRTEERRAEQVRMLLAGKLIDTAGIGYEFDAWHIGAVAEGPGIQAAIRRLATSLDRRLLSVRGEAGAVWVWIGGRSQTATREVLDLTEACWPKQAHLALGEPGWGIDGWRFTHRQAKMAATVGERGAPSVVGYADVALLAAAIGDEILSDSLRHVYLEPLERQPDGGATLRQTLHAYFAAGRNITSAAAALGLARQTVSLRLRSVEDRIGRPLDTCGAELEIALHLSDRSSDSATADR